MTANIMKMQIFHKIKSNLKGPFRSQKVTFIIRNLFFKGIFLFTLYYWHIKNVYSINYVLSPRTLVKLQTYKFRANKKLECAMYRL